MLICVLKALIWHGVHSTLAYVVGFNKQQHEMCALDCPKLVFMCKYVIAYLFCASMTVLDEWGLISGRVRNFCLHCNIQMESGPDPFSYPTHDGVLFRL